MNGNKKKRLSSKETTALDVFSVGMLLKQENKLETAKTCFETTLEMKGETARCHFQIAQILIIQNKNEEALKHIRMARNSNRYDTQYKKIEEMLCNHIAKFGHISFHQKIYQ